MGRQGGRPCHEPSPASRDLPSRDPGARLLAEQLKDLEALARAGGEPDASQEEDGAGFFGEDDGRRARQEQRTFEKMMRAKKQIDRLKRKLRRQGVAEGQLDYEVDMAMMRRTQRPRVRAKIEARKRMLLARNARTSKQCKAGYATREGRGRATRDNKGRFIKNT